MKIKTFEFNPLGVNTYVLSDETGECVVIDAACYYADEQELLLNYLLDHDFVVKHLINTHLHFDHLFGVNLLAERFDLPLLHHPDDAFLLEDIATQMGLFGFPSHHANYRPGRSVDLKEGDRISFGNHTLQILHVPGHSPGSIAFYEAEAAVVISGDALFNSGIGRTDPVAAMRHSLPASATSCISCRKRHVSIPVMDHIPPSEMRNGTIRLST